MITQRQPTTMESKSDEDASSPPPPPAQATSASASTSGAKDDATIAECWQAVESLVEIFGFPADVANTAVNEVGPDVTACYNYILDHQLAKDGGGSVVPIDSCPHIAQHVQVTPVQIKEYFAHAGRPMMEIPCCMPSNQSKPTGGLKSDQSDSEQCPLGENWFCLATKTIACSRYVNGHALQHFQQSGNCIAVSLADLSVWCHVCESYIKDSSTTTTTTTTSDTPILKPILQTLEEIKFGGGREGGGDDGESSKVES